MASLTDDYLNITDSYYSLWNNIRTDYSGIEYSLKQIYILPDLTDEYGCLVDIDKIFADIAIGEKPLVAIKGSAGSGKTSLISYICNSSVILGTDTGIMVWALPKSMFFLRTIMGECSMYAKKNGKERMVLVFENIMGLDIDLEEIFKTISQRQATLYPHISVIITYRSNDDSCSYSQIETLSIQPFSKAKIQLYVNKHEALNNESRNYNETILPLINRFGIETIGTPFILHQLLNLSYKVKINTNEDIYSSLIDVGIGRQTCFYLEIIAFLMFSTQTYCIPVESLYNYLNHLEEKPSEIDTNPIELRNIKTSLKGLCIVEDKYISFIHRSIYDYSLASCVASLLYKLCSHNDDTNAFCQLYKLFSSGKFDKTTIAYFESSIKKNDNFPLSILVKQLERLVSNYLTGELNQNHCTEKQNVQVSFLPQFQTEMSIFYNFITLYHAALKANGSIRMFEHSNNADKAFMNYLRLFSVFGDENELDLSGLDFSHHDFSGIVFNGINLSACNLRNCTFVYSKLKNVILKEADLYSSNLSCAQLQNVDLSYANLQNVNFSECNIINTTLCSSNLKAADLCRCSLKHVNCQNANFHLTNLDYAICVDGHFEGSNFSNSFLRNTVFSDSNFEGTNFNEVILREYESFL